MWAMIFWLHVEVFDQQDQAQIRVLQLELIARVAPDTGGRPAVPAKLDKTGIFKHFQNARENHTAVHLPDCIHAQTQNSNAGKVCKFPIFWVYKNTAFTIELAVFIHSDLMDDFSHGLTSLAVNDRFDMLFNDVLQGRQRVGARAHSLRDEPFIRARADSLPMNRVMAAAF